MSVTDRFWSKVDRTGDHWKWTAGKLSTGYGAFRLDGRTQCAHRVAWELTFGPIAEGYEVHHLCFDIQCVNPAHLESITRAKHRQIGVRKPRQDNTSGFTGVHRHTPTTWRARVQMNRVHYDLGLFLCLGQAAKAVRDKKSDLGFGK